MLTYTIKDEFGRTATASITVTVVVRPPDNRPPAAKDDLAGTTFNTPVTIDVLANDNDPDGDTITLDSITQPAAGAGQASIVGTAVRFTPPAGFEGLASFKYTISDTAGAKSTATVLIQVAPRVQVSPVANPDLVPPPLLTGATTTIRPTDNDIDPDAPNSELRVSVLGSTPGLATSLGPNGLTVTIRAGNTPGTYTVPYTVIDRDGRTAESTITVIVDYPFNNPPVANPDTFTIVLQDGAADARPRQRHRRRGRRTRARVRHPAGERRIGREGRPAGPVHTDRRRSRCIGDVHLHRP